MNSSTLEELKNKLSETINKMEHTSVVLGATLASHAQILRGMDLETASVYASVLKLDNENKRARKLLEQCRDKLKCISSIESEEADQIAHTLNEGAVAQIRIGEETYNLSIDILVEIGRPAESFINSLKDKDPISRKIAASVLGRIGDSRVIGSLMQALNDKDHGVQIEAQNAIEQIEKRRETY